MPLNRLPTVSIDILYALNSESQPRYSAETKPHFDAYLCAFQKWTRFFSE